MSKAQTNKSSFLKRFMLILSPSNFEPIADFCFQENITGNAVNYVFK